MDGHKGDNFETLSHIPLKNEYSTADVPDLNYKNDLGKPGEAPFTRGVYPQMYRERMWRIFELSGYGTPEDERERILYLLKHGETGFIMEIDMMTSYHLYDLDHPEVLSRKEDVGLCGPPLMSLRDYETVLEGLPLEDLYVHPGGGIIQYAPFAHASYFSVAQKRGIPLHKLRGTGQSDYFISYLSCPIKDQIPPRPGLRLNCDFIEFCVQNVPKWVPVSIPGYNAAESGINAYQEVAAVLANAVAYIEEILRRGRLKIDDFAYGIGGVNFSCGRDFFEDIAKIRAARRMWYKLLHDRYGAKDPRSHKMRIHVVTAGSWMTYRQPLNNIVRGTMYAMAAALAGVQSLGVSSYDEAISVPSEEAHLVAVRTQQIIQYESNITSVADPLGGSYYVECLTNEIEKKAWDYLQKIEDAGGFISILESGWLHREAMKGMVDREKRIANGELKIVGQNCFQMDEEPHKVPPFKSNPQVWQIALDKLQRTRKDRDQKQVDEALAELREVCNSDQNIMPAMLKTVQTYATIGEIGAVYREAFDTWNAPIPV
ncbi:MAG: acyl-CoA mutase large subunit family protein [Candidatus Tectomicrobia bacterium]|uniref:Acyl-CoA mutase large subunit family protein n=1 Tax=Tectimicrobiota bacterium TaxID=2528274 RepID=A0A933GNS1_UNCTE|nr:acyl-CoA mutase large subunit family protein [Candidatus Tectomicrobia bacterium]